MRAALAALALTGCVSDVPRPIPPPGGGAPVQRLSQLGLFSGDLARQVPRAGLVPYEVNASLYADGASKHRFVLVPPGATIHATEDRWELPVGTYLVKTFGVVLDARDPARGERLVETRFLVKTADGYTASTYVWTDEQTDAVASAGNVDVPVSTIDATGAPQVVRFHVPGTSQCGSCHEDRALGWRARQLDRGTQIADLVTAGVVDAPPPAHLVLADPFGPAPLEARARSYLDANCSHCHGRGGSAEDTGLFWDLEHTDEAHRPACRDTPSVDGRDRVLVPGHPEDSELLARMASTDGDVRMPRGPTRIPDRAGMALLADWITAMTPAGCP